MPYEIYLYYILEKNYVTVTLWIIQTTLLLVFQSVLEWSVWSGVLFAKNSFVLHIRCLKLRSSSTIKVLLVYVTHDLFLAIKRNCLVFLRKVSCFLSWFCVKSQLHDCHTHTPSILVFLITFLSATEQFNIIFHII